MPLTKAADCPKHRPEHHHGRCPIQTDLKAFTRRVYSRIAFDQLYEILCCAQGARIPANSCLAVDSLDGGGGVYSCHQHINGHLPPHVIRD